MKPESETLSTADLANVRTQATPESTDDPNNTASTRGSRGPAGPGHLLDQPHTEEASSEDARAATRSATGGSPGGAPDTNAPLFDPHIGEGLRTRWNEIQVGFVDEPRTAVERADHLVAEAIKQLADSFATTRQKLEDEWAQGSDVSTENLRLALQRYRSFFNRLLSL